MEIKKSAYPRWARTAPWSQLDDSSLWLEQQQLWWIHLPQTNIFWMHEESLQDIFPSSQPAVSSCLSSFSTRGSKPSVSSETRWWRRAPTRHHPATQARVTSSHDGTHGCPLMLLFIVHNISWFHVHLLEFANKCAHRTLLFYAFKKKSDYSKNMVYWWWNLGDKIH